MARQEETVMDWAARLRASLAPREAEPAGVAPQGLSDRAEDTAAADAAEDLAMRPAVQPEPVTLEPATPEPVPPEPDATGLGPLAALLSVAPPPVEVRPLLLVPPPGPAVPPPEAGATPTPAGLLSFLASTAPVRADSAAGTSPLLSALGGEASAAPATMEAPPPAEARTPQAILAGLAILKAASPPGEGVAEEPVAVEAPAADPPPPPPAAPPIPAPAAAQVAAAPAEDPLGAEALQAASRILFGKPMPAEADGDSAEWVGIARSLEEALGSWRALFLGVPQPDLPLAGALACGRRALVPVLHATESHPGRFGRLLSALEAKGLDGGEARLLQATVGADPERLPPRGALAQELLEREESWDYLRIGVPRLLLGLMWRGVPMLTARVRWLMLSTENRIEEGFAVKALSGEWRLMAERPAVLNLANPRAALRPGVQLWRGPLA